MTNPIVNKRLYDCSKEYTQQFEKALVIEKQRELTKEEKKGLKEKEIPYAMAHNFGLGLDDYDGNGVKDYLSFNSKSNVDNCSVSNKPFSKRNDVYLELNGVAVINESWDGQFITRVVLEPKKKALVIIEMDHDYNESKRTIMYK